MIKQKCTLAIFGLAAFGLVGGTSTEAAADVSLSTPIGSCVKSTSTGTIFYDWKGFMNLHASQSMSVDCGLQYWAQGSSGNVRVVAAQVEDRSTSKRIDCRMRIHDMFGRELWNGGTKFSGTNNNETGVFGMNWTAPSAITDVGNPYVTCTIPAHTTTSPSGVLGFVSAG